MRETSIERYLIQQVKDLGGLCPKWESPGTTGVPDRIILLPSSRVFWAETKAPRGRLSERQKLIHRQFEERGHHVHVPWNKAHVDDLIERILRGDAE